MVRRSKNSKLEIFVLQQDLLGDDRHEFAILGLCHTWVRRPRCTANRASSGAVANSGKQWGLLPWFLE